MNEPTRGELGKARRALSKGLKEFNPSEERLREIIDYFRAKGIIIMSHGSEYLGNFLRKQLPLQSNDHFDSQKAGADAALDAGDEQYKRNWANTVLSIVRQPDFIDMVSTDVTDIIGLPDGPPKHRSGLVAALMPVSAREVGLVAVGHRRSRDPRHKHVLTVWGFPDK